MMGYEPQRQVPLADVMRLVLPAELQTQLLRVCLLSGPEVRQGWEKWGQTKHVLGDSRYGLKRLLALLYHGLMRNQIPLEKELQTYLRSAYVHEQSRTEVVRRACREALVCLAERDMPAVVLKGMMAAETVYPEACLRHCHDLDLLVAPGRRDAAAHALVEAGFRPAAAPRGGPEPARVLEHGCGFPVSLHANLFRLVPYNLGLDDVWQRLVTVTVAGVQAQALSPADNLVHICGHAATVGSRSPAWAADAWFLISRHPELDWDRVLRSAAAGHLALPLLVTLEYLVAALDAPVPWRVLEALRAHAASAGSVSREATLAAALLSTRGRPFELLKSSQGRRRFQVARWLVLPPPQSLRWLEGPVPAWWIPWLYLYRPVRYVVRVLATFVRNLLGGGEP